MTTLGIVQDIRQVRIRGWSYVRKSGGFASALKSKRARLGRRPLQEGGATHPPQRLGGSGGGGGVDGGGEVDGLAVVEAAVVFDGFADGEFPFVGRSGGDDAFERGGEFAAGLPGLFGRAGPGPVDFVLGDANVLEAGGGEYACQFVFVGEAKDGGRVGRRRRDVDVFQEGAEHGGEERIFFERAPSDEGDAAAGLEDATHFGEGFVDVGNEHDAEAAGDAVEEAGGEWELLGVGGAEVDVLDAASGSVFFGDLEHFADEVGGGDAALGTDGGGKTEGRFAGAAGEIEDVHTGRNGGALNNEFGGVTGLEGELGIPFFPGWGGAEPVLADGFFGVGSGSGGHDGILRFGFANVKRGNGVHTEGTEEAHPSQKALRAGRGRGEA